MSTCASLEATLEQFHADVAAHAGGPDDDGMNNTMAAQMMSIMETMDGLTDIDLIKATSLTNIIIAGPWNDDQNSGFPRDWPRAIPWSSCSTPASHSNSA